MTRPATPSVTSVDHETPPTIRGSLPLVVIKPGAVPLRQYIRDLSHHRDLIRVLAGREIKLRYRQTALGVTWVVLQPLLAAGVLGFVFGRIARLPTEGIPYFVFAYAGMLCWNGFSTVITRTTSSLVSNTSLVSKVYFPRLILPLSAVPAVLLDFGVSFVVMVVLLVTNHLTPGSRLLLLPVWLALTLLLAEGMGCFFAAVSVRYRDIPQIIPVTLQLLLYASPVAYSVQAVPDRYQALYHLNPLAGLLEAVRWSVLNTSAPAGRYLAYSAFSACFAFLAGTVFLERLERRFADVI